MATHSELPEHTIINTKTARPELREDNLQYNRQDMDQEQKLDLNPVMNNSSSVHVHVNNDVGVYCGKITGTVYSKKNNDVVPNATLRLYFGGDSTMPVYVASADQGGNFVIPELPPGFYILAAEQTTYQKCRSGYIKVLPCQTAHTSVYMECNCYYCQKAK